MELNIAFFAKVTGDNSTAKHFLEISDVRKKAINSVFWNASMKQWLDCWLSNSTCEVFSSAYLYKSTIWGAVLAFAVLLTVFLILLEGSSLGIPAPESKCICFQFCPFVDEAILLRYFWYCIHINCSCNKIKCMTGCGNHWGNKLALGSSHVIFLISKPELH